MWTLVSKFNLLPKTNIKFGYPAKKDKHEVQRIVLKFTSKANLILWNKNIYIYKIPVYHVTTFIYYIVMVYGCFEINAQNDVSGCIFRSVLNYSIKC